MRILSAILSMFLLVAVNGVARAAETPSDARIHDQVRVKLANDPDVKGGALGVEVEQGVVTLRGKVKEERFKQKAERLAKKVKGVKKVVNQLQTETQEPAQPGPRP